MAPVTNDHLELLTIKELNFSLKTMETKGFISISYHHKCLIQLFLIHLNTYVMGLRPLEIFLVERRSTFSVYVGLSGFLYD